jgi:hypothetical protein
MVSAQCRNNSVTCAVKAVALTIRDLAVEAYDTLDRFWFVRDIKIIEQTQATVTIHLTIGSDLFVQAFLSESSQRLSFALVGQRGRLYGRERGVWHRHPFGQPEHHEPAPESASVRPLTQFMTEVETILVEHDLI